jgi:site-specific recombinase XerD
MPTNIAQPIRQFFEQHLVAERNLSTHTVLAYRDTLKLLLAFAAKYHRKSCEELTIEDLSADIIKKFLADLETTRHNGIRTRNARLAAIHAFFRYLATLDPRFLVSCQGVLNVRFKRHNRRVLDYLEHDDVMRMIQQISPQDRSGRRDEAILRLLYTTGSRAQEVVDIDISDVRFSRPHSVLIHGKGYKERTCPLWPEDIAALKVYLDERSVKLTDRTPLFVNAKGNRLTRFGLRYIVAHWAAAAGKANPALLTRKIGPHTIRHTTAMHMLRSGVEFNAIRSWLGHASEETTHEYAEIDLEMKRKTLQSVEKLLPKVTKQGPTWQRDAGILNWLSKL